MLPDGLEAFFFAALLPRLPVFELIQTYGNVSEHDMFNTFNMGLGMVLAVPEEQADRAMDILRDAGETDAAVIGHVTRGDGGVSFGEVCPPVV